MTASNAFIEHRVHALAAVYLTRRTDLELREFKMADLDLLVRIVSDDLKPEVLRNSFVSFACILQGTSVPLPDAAAANKQLKSWAKHHKQHRRYFFPVLVLLFSMEDDTGYFGWYSQPMIDQELHPKLLHPADIECFLLSRPALDEIVEKIVQWYDVLTNTLTGDE